MFAWLTKLLQALFGHTTNTTTTESTTTKVTGDVNKQALCMGINDYSGTQNDLRGCVNDATNWGNLLKSKGYNVTVLLDSQVTRATVIAKLQQLTQTQGLTHFVLTYSGHGSQTADTNGDEDGGKDETLYLYDGHLVDDDIRGILNKIPSGVKVTVISDSCHSGTVTRAFLSTMNDTSFYSKPRYVPPEDVTDAAMLEGIPFKKSIMCPEEGMNHILIAGAKDTEYSYDANIGGQPCGAFTYYALKVLQENPSVSYNDFIAKLRTYIPNGQYPQTPQLEGKEADKNQIMFA